MNSNDAYLSFVVFKLTLLLSNLAPRNPSIYGRQYDPSRSDHELLEDLDSYDGAREDAMREQALLRQFHRNSRDGEAQFDAPMYVI